jgi:hypothetical protein
MLIITLLLEAVALDRPVQKPQLSHLREVLE